MATVNWEVRKRRLAEYHKLNKEAEAAWFKAQQQWEKKGIQPGAFTAFIEGYKAGKEVETEAK